MAKPLQDGQPLRKRRAPDASSSPKTFPDEYEIFAQEGQRVETLRRRLEQPVEVHEYKHEEQDPYGERPVLPERMHRHALDDNPRAGRRAILDLPERRAKGDVPRDHSRSPRGEYACLVSEAGVVPWADPPPGSVEAKVTRELQYKHLAAELREKMDQAIIKQLGEHFDLGATKGVPTGHRSAGATTHIEDARDERGSQAGRVCGQGPLDRRWS